MYTKHVLVDESPTLMKIKMGNDNVLFPPDVANDTGVELGPVEAIQVVLLIDCVIQSVNAIQKTDNLQTAYQLIKMGPVLSSRQAQSVLEIKVVLTRCDNCSDGYLLRAGTKSAKAARAGASRRPLQDISSSNTNPYTWATCDFSLFYFKRI